MGNAGNTIFYSANWYASRSTDGGNSFTYVNPYTNFPSVNGGFCCDQIVNYAPSQDMTLWLLQYIKSSTTGTQRIARAVGTGVATNTWAYYDFTPQFFGFASGNWLDFPNVTISSNFLYATSNVFTTATDSFSGSVIFRIPLSELAAGGTVNVSWLTRTDVGSLRCVEGAGTTMYWADLLSTTSIRIHRWDDGGGSIFWDDVGINAFTFLSRDGIATSPDGTNWALRADSRILGAFRRAGVLGFMWGAKQTGAARPYPYTIVAQFNEATRAFISQSDIWSDIVAWLYGTAMVNSAGNLGGLINYGGGSFYPNTSAWLVDDVSPAIAPLTNVFAAGSDDGPNNNAWGDYLTTRRHRTDTNTYVGAAHYLSGGGNGANVVPRYLRFGRERDFSAINTPPTITAVGVTRQQGSPTSNSTIANASDLEQAENTLSVTVNGSSSATVNGVTVSGISISAAGVVTANVVASCTASTASFTLRVTDSGSLFDEATLTVTVTSNTAPTLSYSNQSVAAGGSLTVNPASGPSDNGSISSIIVQSVGTYTGTISVNSAGVVSISGAKPGGTHTITIRATDNCGAFTDASFSLTVNCQTITVNPASLPSGTQNVFYSQSITATGGTPSYSFAVISGTPPTGVNLSSGGTLSGTPSATGTFNFTVRATDANGCFGDRAYSVTITTSCPTITVNPASLPNGSVGAGYNQSISASGGTPAYSFAVLSGTPPTGVSLSSGGTLSGTPSAGGTFNFTVRATDSAGCFGDRAYSITISQGPCIPVSISTTLTGPPGGTITIPITVGDLTGRGVVSYDFTLTFNTSVLTLQNPAVDAAGTLSSGMVVTPNTTVPGQLTVSGFSTTPLSGAGTLLNLKFNIVGAAGACTPLTWTAFRFNEKEPCATTSNGQFCVSNTFSISGTISYCIAAAKKVAGVLLTAATQSVTSTTDSSGNYSLTGLNGGAVTVTPTKTGNVNGISSFDASQVAQHVAGIITLGACQITAGDASNNGTLSSFDAALIAQYVAGIINAGNITGTWKFTPATRSYTPLSSNQTGQNYDAILVGDVSGNWTPPLANTASFEPRSFGTDGIAVQVPVSLPALSGLPGGAVTIPITVGNLTGAGFVSYDLDLVFNQSVLQLQATPVDATGTLSAGLTITPNVTTGRLRVSAFGVNALSGSGTLLNLKFNIVGAAGTSTALTWQGFIFNEEPQTNLTNGSFNVTGACGTIALSPLTLSNGMVGVGYNQTITASGGTAPYSFSVSAGALPPGIALSSAGVLSGTPTQAGTFNFTVTAADSAQCTGSQSYSVTFSGGGGGSGLQYYPLPRPIRLLDTRAQATGCFTPGAPLQIGSTRTQLARVTCDNITIPANAAAVVGNATVVNFISPGGFITLYPTGAQQPTVSNLNYSANQIIPNAFTVGLGTNGEFNIFASGATDFIVDITGYYAPPGTGGLFYHPLPRPIRLLDTRAQATGCDTPQTPLGNGQTRTEQARITCDGITIPANALAVVGNATVVNFISPGGFITLYPSGAQQPTVSNLNYQANQIIPNAFTVGLGANGAFNIFASAGTDFIVDITGYFSPDAAADVNGVAGLLYNPLPRPIRLLDTRPQATGCDTPQTPLLGGQTRTEPAQVTCDGITIPATARAVVGNATVVNFISAGGFITLWPTGAAQPTVSNLNYSANQIIPNAFTVGLGPAGQFNIFASAGTHFITDLTGYFAP